MSLQVCFFLCMLRGSFGVKKRPSDSRKLLSWSEKLLHVGCHIEAQEPKIGAPFNQAQRSCRRRKSTFFGAVFKVGRSWSLEKFSHGWVLLFKLSTFETGCAMLCCFMVSCLTTTTARVASLHYGALQWHAAPCRMPNEACDHIRCLNKRGSWPLAVMNFSQMLDVLISTVY